MDSCNFTGNTDMYGLGIRIGFYLQWFGTILASWIARGEVEGMRLSNSFFVAATFLALVIQTKENNLRPVETYIILLLTFGGYLYFVPLYIWRLMTGCVPRWDPSRFPRVENGRIFSALNFLLLVAVSLFQLWFWIDRAEQASMDGCEEYGFFFAKVPLDEKAFVVANILFHFFLLFCCVGMISISYAKAVGWYKERKHRRVNSVRVMALQELQTFANLIVAGVVTAATELTIQWNGIEGVADVSSAGQTIPLVIGIGLVTRVLFVGIFRGGGDYNGPNSPGDLDNFPEGFSSGSSSDGPRRHEGDPVDVDIFPIIQGHRPAPSRNGPRGEGVRPVDMNMFPPAPAHPGPIHMAAHRPVGIAAFPPLQKGSPPKRHRRS